MPIKPDREYRSIAAFKPAVEEFTVEGYASTFEPYPLWNDGTNDYYERIEPTAFDKADMSDVIMQYDHMGRVYARQSNGSLALDIDEKGLKVRADLSRSSGAKGLYEDIAAELITQMSFAFVVAPDGDYYDEEKRERVITRIKKVYDVSAVSIPANPNTEIGISARSYFEGVIEMRRLEEARRANEIKRIKLLMEV